MLHPFDFYWQGLHVHPDHRGQGLAGGLMDLAEFPTGRTLTAGNLDESSPAAIQRVFARAGRAWQWGLQAP